MDDNEVEMSSSSEEGESGDDIGEILEKEPSETPSNRKRECFDVSVPKHLTKKMKSNELYKPPTAEELNNLKETESMFHSCLFRLQVDELLSEIKLKMKLKSSLQTWVKSLKEFLKHLPETESFPINKQPWLKKATKVPLSFHPKNKNAVFKFIPPTDVFEIGSYLLDTVCSPEPVIDIALKIPKACWQKGDFLNQIYHRKRALYLTYLAKVLRKSDLIESLQFSHHHGCHLKPVLLLRPKGKIGKHFTVSLLPFPEFDSFKLLRFIPQRSNVRHSWFYETEDREHDQDIPTPYYNSTVLLDLLIPQLTDFLQKNISTQSLKDGIMLLKVWCIQRRMIYGGKSVVSGFILSMLVSYLLLKNKISSLMSSYQVFRNTLLSLCRENWMENGINLSTGDKFAPSLQEFHKCFNVVFVEPSGFLNVFYDFTKEAFLVLQHEAKLALNILDSSSSKSFDLLFMNKIAFFQKFECLIHFKDVEKYKACASFLNLDNEVMNHGGDLISTITPRICDFLKKGLGNRIHLLDVKPCSQLLWPVSKLPPDVNQCESITFGVILNQELLLTNLEKGPPADDPKALEFREFWGEKSDLRRFKDGSIHEAVLWPADTIDEKRNVFGEIVKHILQKHAELEPETIVCTGNNIHNVLSLPRFYPKGFPTQGTGEELFFTFMQSFTELTKQLRKMEGLPLLISSIQGSSSAFRFCEVFPPISRLHTCKKTVCNMNNETFTIKSNCDAAPLWIQPLEVIIHFEGSGKWPDDVEAIKRVKAALHIKIKELFNKLGFTALATPSFVDVLKDGYVFRLQIACHKEIGLLKQVTTADGMTKIRENKASKELQCLTEVLPKLNSTLYGLQQQHNTFGTACRLAKRWISSQLLLDFINEVAIELLVAFVYINPKPFTCPSSPQVAFSRFLSLVCTHDWQTYPLVVNLNRELKNSEIAEMHSTFTLQRTTLPPMVIITPVDRTGVMWTRESPSLSILSGLQTLAKASLETLENQLYSPQESDFMQIFRPPLNPYDVLIHLNVKQVPKACFAIDASEEIKIPWYKPYHKTKLESMPIVGYDPLVLYLQQLRETFGDLAYFFSDRIGGSYIAVAWKPDAFSARAFKVAHVNGCMVSGENSDGTVNIIPNLEAIVEDFFKLGRGLVKNIEKLTEKWSIT